MEDSFIISLIETQGISTAMVILLFFYIRESSRKQCEMMNKLLDAVIKEMQEDDCNE